MPANTFPELTEKNTMKKAYKTLDLSNKRNRENSYTTNRFYWWELTGETD